jgi:tyrosyl-tRNA synthetase
MHVQLKALGVTMESYAERRGFSREWAWHRALVNNSTWWSTKTTFLDVLKFMGNGIRLGPMLGRDT